MGVLYGLTYPERARGGTAAQLDVLGLIDHAHAPAAQLFNDTIVRDTLADHAQAMLWRKCRQVNEGLGVGNVSTASLAQYRDYTQYKKAPILR